MKKRSRACEECHRLKIKCEGNTGTGAACERCIRNGLDCVPAAPRLQRDRIRELEAHVEELKNTLRVRSSCSTPTLSPGSLPDDHNQSILSFLDTRIPPNKQQDLLILFANHAGASWPAFSPPIELDLIRAKSPILLLSVVVCTVTQQMQGIELEVHDELVRETMHFLGSEVIGRGQRSLELVQALLIAAFWNKTTRKGLQGSCFQIIQLAADMAIDLGIAGVSLQPTPVAFWSIHEDPASLEARRTWLACYVALSASSISGRRPSPVTWDSHHHECLCLLESMGKPSDILFGQIVRITQLIQEISNHMRLCQIITFVDGNDYKTFATIETLKDKVEAWAAQIPPSLCSSQMLKVWYHVAMILIHEVVLHTPTNKAAFAAPYIPGRIPVKDFPQPVDIIPPLRVGLETLAHHCHAVLDTVTEMDPTAILSLPVFSFTPNVVYALYVLVTVLAAATDPSNTYGQCMSEDAFRIEQCSTKLRTLSARLRALDPAMSSYTTRMIDATEWLEQWYHDYIAIIWRYESNITGTIGTDTME